MASIRERNGRFTVMWRENGRQRGATFSTRREAMKAKARAEAGVIVSSPKPVAVYRASSNGELTLAGYAEGFLAEHSYSPSGRVFAAMVLRNYLLPAFGSTPMKDVTPASVRAFIRKLEESKSGAMIRKIKGFGSAIWMDATDAELVTGKVWRGHRIKQHIARPRAVMTVHEYRMIIEAMHPHCRLLIWLWLAGDCLCHGLRHLLGGPPNVSTANWALGADRDRLSDEALATAAGYFERSSRSASQSCTCTASMMAASIAAPARPTSAPAMNVLRLSSAWPA